MPDDLMTRDETEAEPGREIAERRNGPLAAAPAAQMLDVIARAAADPRVDVAKMEALLRMQRELMSDQAKAEFDRAFDEMRPKLPVIAKQGLVDRGEDRDGKSKGKFPFGRWDDIEEQVRPILIEHGFWLSFTTEIAPQGGISVIGTLRHRGGHERTASIGPLPADNSGGKNPVQAVGSTASYGRRYTTIMLLNLAFKGGADDDGQGGAPVDDFIDEERVSELSRLLKQTDSNVENFLKNFGVVTVSEIRDSQYQKAKGMLRRKKERLEEERHASS